MSTTTPDRALTPTLVLMGSGRTVQDFVVPTVNSLLISCVPEVDKRFPFRTVVVPRDRMEKQLKDAAEAQGCKLSDNWQDCLCQFAAAGWDIQTPTSANPNYTFRVRGLNLVI